MKFVPLRLQLSVTVGSTAVFTWTDLSLHTHGTPIYTLYRKLEGSSVPYAPIYVGTAPTYEDTATPEFGNHYLYYVVGQIRRIVMTSNIVEVEGLGEAGSWLTWGQTDIHPFFTPLGADSTKTFAELP